MRPTALTAPRPPRPQHHRAAVITQRSRPGPAPRPQRTATTRTHQLTVGEPFLDSGSVGPYREHSASARDTALPDALGQETPGGPFVCPHRHGAAAYQQHTQPSTHQDPSAPTMPGNRPPRRIPQRRSTGRPAPQTPAPATGAVVGARPAHPTPTLPAVRRAPAARGRPARLLHPVGDLVPGHPHGAGPPGHHPDQQRADDPPPRPHRLRATSPRRPIARPRPAAHA